MPGQLRSLVPGIPGAEGQVSAMQAALVAKQHGRVRIDTTVRTQLATFVELLEDTTRPTHIEELVPGDAIHLGAVDAAKPGMGGVWFTHAGDALVWRFPFPPSVQSQLSSFDNPTGPITNSDLELAGTVVQQAVLSDHAPLSGETIHTLCDHTPAVSWRQKGSSTSTQVRASLLRMVSLLRRNQRVNHQISHIAGSDNSMADDASRLQHLTDAQFLAHFNSTYPQAKPWQLCSPSAQLSSTVVCMLKNVDMSTSDLNIAIQSFPTTPVEPSPPVPSPTMAYPRHQLHAQGSRAGLHHHIPSYT